MPLSAQSFLGADAFSVKALTGFMFGQAQEIVYQGNPPNNSNPYTSLLLWDFKPLIYFGLEAGFNNQSPWLNKGLYSSLALKAGLPLKTGIIEDFDWLSTTNSFITHYSRHDAYSRNAFEELFAGFGTFTADLSAGYSWAFLDKVWLRPYGTLSYFRFSWKSFDGYAQYSGNSDAASPGNIAWDPNSLKDPRSGPAINYTQNWLIFSPGVAAGIYFSEFLNMTFSMSITPLIYGFNRDDHLSSTKSYLYLDYVEFGIYMRHELSFEFLPYRNLSFGFSAVLMNLSGSKGDNYTSKFGGPFELYRNVAGGGFTFADITLSAKYVF